MAEIFDRAYYERKLEQNRNLAAAAQLPHIREMHLQLVEFYALALSVSDECEGPRSTLAIARVRTH